MILFVGDENKGFFLEDISIELSQEIKYTGLLLHIGDAKTVITSAPYDFIVIDITQFVDSVDEIVSVIKTIITTMAVPVVMYAVGISDNSEVVLKLSEIGITAFIRGVTPPTQREQFRGYINHYQPISFVPEIEKQERPPKDTAIQSKKYKSISLCGAERRIGTTTQAVQIVKYLQYNGKTAAYVEMNNTGFVNQLARVYSDVVFDTAKNKVTYKNIDFFCVKENLSEILKMNYDYFVFDYGSADEPYFNAISFIEKDIAIIVCGSSPNEWDATNAVLRKSLLNDAFYIFNFCDTSEHTDIRELMQERAKKTIFSEYTPDFCQFTANRNTLYKQIIIPEKLNVSKPMKKGIFGFKRRQKQ